MHKTISRVIAGVLLMWVLASCIDDSFTTSPSAQPRFSTDTLRLAPTFTEVPTPTASMRVINPNDKGIVVSRIAFADPEMADLFRLNVDGVPGREFTDVEIRANDSVFLLVEATFPANATHLPVEINAPLRFTVNGVNSTVVLSAVTQDAVTLTGLTVDTDMTLDPSRPYRVIDSLIVAQGARLTIPGGTRLHFHDGAFMRVDGTLIAEGTPAEPVDFTGDRFGYVAGNIPYDIMSGQWDGIIFTPTAGASRMESTTVRNSLYGVVLDSVGAPGGAPALTLVNCRLRNTKSTALLSLASSVSAYGCEFAEAPDGVVALYGGSHIFNHCTLANAYLFSAVTGPLLLLDGDDISARISNSILYGFGSSVSPGDLTDRDVIITRSLLREEGSDDDNFIGCLWGVDPQYLTVREDYFFDYRLAPESEARGAADPALTLPEAATDPYGLPRTTTLGAYE